VHGLVFANNTGSSATITLKVYINSLGTTTTVATGITVSANSTYTWPKPIDVNAGDYIQAAASTGSAIVCLYSVYEGSAPAVAVGFTPRGTWSSVATYAINDVVAYNGSSYLAMLAGTNQQPDTATTYWLILAEKGATGSGDVTGPASSVDSELALYSSTTGKIIKRASLTGIVKATSGVASAATAGTDYLAPPSGTSILKANSGGALDNATAGTDYLAPPSGTSILKANSGGALANATAGTDYVAPGGALGTPSSGTLTNCTSIPVNQATGTLPVANGGTGITSFGTGVATALGNAIDAINGFISYATFKPASGKSLTVSNTLTLAGTDSTTMTFPGASASIGYLNIPQVGGAAKTSSYNTQTLTDSGQLAVMNGASLTYTIPANSSVAYPVGTVLTIANIYAGNLTIAITTDTMTLAGGTSTGNRTLAQNGVATAVKVTSTSWIISGAGLT
jgi:hypothetical protein